MSKGLLQRFRRDLGQALPIYGFVKRQNVFVGSASSDQTQARLRVITASGGTQISPRLSVINRSIDEILNDLGGEEIEQEYPLLIRSFIQLAANTRDQRSFTRHHYVKLTELSYDSVFSEFVDCVRLYVSPFVEHHGSLNVIWSIVEEHWETHKNAMPPQILVIPLVLRRTDASVLVRRFLEDIFSELKPHDIRLKILKEYRATQGR